MNDFEFSYIGQERNARRIVLEKKLAKPEELAVMSCNDVASLVQKHFVVYRCEDDLLFVQKNKLAEFNKITEWCCR